MSEQEFNKKWKDVDTDNLSDEQLKQYKEDCFEMYEETGFVDIFDSPYDEPADHNGMRFKVIGRASVEKKEADIEALPLWKVKFENGDEAFCYPEEIAIIEHRDKTNELKYKHAINARSLRELLENKVSSTIGPFVMKGSDGIFATRIEHKTGKAILIHWACDGDYTHAMLIPENEFEDDDRVEEAIEAFRDRI